MTSSFDGYILGVVLKNSKSDTPYHCSNFGCDNNLYALFMCKVHYEEARRLDVKKCKIDGCVSNERRNGLCYHHGKLNLEKKKCIEKDCRRLSFRDGQCKKHVKWNSNGCSSTGCTSKNIISLDPDLCSKHYYQRRYRSSKVVDSYLSKKCK